MYGHVYIHGPGKMCEKMRGAPMSTYCKILFIILFQNLFENHLFENLLLEVMVVSTDSVVLKLLELYRRANKTCQGKFACLYGLYNLADNIHF